MARLVLENGVTHVVHLATLLSAVGERNPALALKVNIHGCQVGGGGCQVVGGGCQVGGLKDNIHGCQVGGGWPRGGCCWRGV